VYISAPSRQITTLPFHLEFEGAAMGKYPNGLKFSTADITATPVLLKVYDDNGLKQFTTFASFSRSVFVLESNRAFERLAAEYQSKLADPKLTPMDRERIEKEYEQKRDSISKSDYAINYVRTDGGTLPPSILHKVLVDVLSTWARQAAVEKRVLQYRVDVLTTKILDRALLDGNDYFTALTILRNKINDVLSNAVQISKIPGTELIRTPTDHASLSEIRIQLQDVIRFQVEPLIMTARSSGYVQDPVRSLQILEAQLSFDQRWRDSARARESALRNALTTYQQDNTARVAESVPPLGRPATNTTAQQQQPSDTVTQVNESFLDRVIDLANRNADREYRQHMVDEIRGAALDVVPAESAVAYDTELINAFRSQPSGAYNPAAAAAIRSRFENSLQTVVTAINQLNEIYTLASRQLNPVTELYGLSGPMTTRTERAISLSYLALYGLLVLFLSLPLIVIGSLLHNRVQEEEELEHHLHPEVT